MEYTPEVSGAQPPVAGSPGGSPEPEGSQPQVSASPGERAQSETSSLNEGSPIGTSSQGGTSSSEERSAIGSIQHLGGAARGRAMRTADTGIGMVASRIERLGKALEQAGQQFEENGGGMEGKLFSYAAGWTRRASGTLRDSSTEDVLRNLRQTLRQRPYLVFGGALLLSFLASRMIRE